MRVKGILSFLGLVAYLSHGISGTDPADYTYANLMTLLERNTALTTFRIGPASATCTSDADCSAHSGTKCYGVTGCKVCVCDPYEYGFIPSVIGSLANSYSRRSYYETGSKKCLKPVLIDAACEHNDQCPDNGSGSRSCTNSVCVCASGYVAQSDKMGCRRSRYNEACSSNADCDSGFTCTSSKCVCDNSNKYWDVSSPTTGDASSSACRRARFNQACASNAECDSAAGPHDSNTYFTCQSNACKCNPTYYAQDGSPSDGTAGSAACKKVEIGQTGCNTNGDQNGVCYDGHNNRTVCVSSTCKCQQHYPTKASDSRSCSKIAYGQTGCKTQSGSDAQAFTDNPTNNNMRCADHSSANLVCGVDSSVLNKCVCDTTHPKWNSATSSCETLKVGDTGCKTVVSGNGMVEAYPGSNLPADQKARCSPSGVAECDGSGSGTCRCPTTMPVLETSDMGVQTCRKVKVNENGCGARINTNAVDYTGADNSRCYGTNVQCSTDTCTCTANFPTPNANNLQDCGTSQWGQSCDANVDCAGDLVCNTGTSKCHCDNANDWYDDEKYTTAERTGMSNSNACRRINTGATGCRSDASLCEANRINANSAICNSGTCTCKVGFRLYETNWCDYETLYGGACASAGIECSTGNMTCSNDTCACVANNIHDGTKKQCRHMDSSYTIASGATCTHDLVANTITDIGQRGISTANRNKWQDKTSSTQENGLNPTQAVQVCGANLICHACTAGTTTKTCKTYVLPSNPNKAGRPGIFLPITILVALTARALF